MPDMRWIAGGAFAVAVALTVAGSPAAGAAALRPGRTGQVALRSAPLRGTARLSFGRPPVATGLAGVSCRGPSLCMAVGITGIFGQQPTHLASEIWNGRSWHGLVTPAPAHALGLYALSCASGTQCMATGSNRTGGTSFAFAQSWNGRAWKMLPVAPGQDTLTGISCPALARCMAVGHTGPLAAQSPSAAAERWDGSSW